VQRGAVQDVGLLNRAGFVDLLKGYKRVRRSALGGEEAATFRPLRFVARNLADHVVLQPKGDERAGFVAFFGCDELGNAVSVDGHATAALATYGDIAIGACGRTRRHAKQW